jgi:hypothetical protein
MTHFREGDRIWREAKSLSRKKRRHTDLAAWVRETGARYAALREAHDKLARAVLLTADRAARTAILDEAERAGEQMDKAEVAWLAALIALDEGTAFSRWTEGVIGYVLQPRGHA